MAQLPNNAEHRALAEITEAAKHKLMQTLFGSKELEARNREAAKNHLMAVQLLLARRPK